MMNLITLDSLADSRCYSQLHQLLLCT